MKKVVLLLLAAALILACGCSMPAQTEPSESSPARTDITVVPPPQSASRLFSVAWYLPQGTVFNPITDTVLLNSCYSTLVYDGLFRLGPNFMPEKVLCESWEQNGNTYIFTIKSGVLFHDGSTLTAADVVYSLNLAKNSPNYSARLSKVSSIVAVEPLKVSISLTSPSGGLPALLDIPIIKSGTGVNASNPDGAGVSAVGCGRYSPLITDDSSYLALNTSYHSPIPDPDLEFILLVRIEDLDTLIYSFSAGTVDVMTEDPLDADRIVYHGDAYIYEVPTRSLHYLMFNSRRLQSDEVRRALCRMIDREAVCAGALDGYVRPNYGLFPAGSANDSTAREIVGYDPAAGLAALQNAGFDFGGGELTLLVCSDNPYKLSAAQSVAAMLETCGVRVSLSALKWDDYLSALKKGSFDIAYCETSVAADFDFTFLLGSNGSLNYGGLKSSGLDALLSAFATAPLGTTRFISEDLIQTVAELSPICVIGYENLIFKIRRTYSVSGVIAVQSDCFYNILDWKVTYIP